MDYKYQCWAGTPNARDPGIAELIVSPENVED
jgi:hypothetical protein